MISDFQLFRWYYVEICCASTNINLCMIQILKCNSLTFS